MAVDEICAKGAEEIDLKPYMSEKWMKDPMLPTNMCVIMFKDKIPLWRTRPGSIDKCKFFIIGGDFEEMEEGEKLQEPYTIVCKDEWSDFYTFGQWNTLEEVLAWIEDPKINQLF